MVKKLEHKMGKFTGYDTDGEGWKVAPCYQERMQRILEEYSGVKKLVDDVSAFAAKRNAEIEHEKTKLWNEIREDLGITIADLNFNWMDGWVRPVPEPEKEGKKKEGK